MMHEDVYDPWYEEDLYDYDPIYPELGECRECGSVSYGSDYCVPCGDVNEELEMESEYGKTKAEKREQQRLKLKRGPVRHLEGDYRPATFGVKKGKKR